MARHNLLSVSSRREHQRIDGQDGAEADRVREHYKTCFGMGRPGE
jgi:hypothetical protein